MITAITREIVWDSKADGADGHGYFHPRACVVSRSGRQSLFMTLQPHSGDDVFQHVRFSESHDVGRTWTDPESIPELGWKPYVEDVFEGICDVVPDYHEPTDTVLAVGHNVYYRNNRLLDTMGTWNKDNIGYRRGFQRFPVYAVRRPDGRWISRKKLYHSSFDECDIFSCGCAQKVLNKDGRICIPITFGYRQRPARKVCSVECAYDGEELKVLSRGNDLTLEVGRGLLEPSMIEFDDTFLITLRAEDGHGYAAVSNDGLQWGAMTPWCWDDGEPLEMSTTQQHWLTLRNELYLVYTRKSACNAAVMRWRAPLYIAKVDTDKLRLIRESENVVFPVLGDGTVEPGHVPLMGNFHTTHIDDDVSIVTVGENRYYENYSGNTLIAWLR